MAVELKRLFEQVSHMDITLLAGEKGIHNLVSWIHMVETVEASGFLEGGEIAFTTGLGLNDKTNLLDLVQNIYSKNAAGIIVNTGPFIDSISNNVLAFCDQHNFPIFIVPWKIHLAEIMRIFCFSITRDDQRQLETAAAFKNSIFFPKQEELYVVPLSQRGFHVNWKYSVCVISLFNGKTNLLTRIESITLSLDHYAHHKYKNFAIFSHDSEILIVLANHTETELHLIINDIRRHAKMLLLEQEELYFGVGKLTKSIRCLYKSYGQAKAIEKLQENKKIDSSLIFYSDMGIYKLLMGIEDKDILDEYYEKTISPLIKYDHKNNSDLAEVLRCYLNHNGSVKETAEELFVHRNTVNYKLNKAEEILNMDLSSLSIRLQLSIGFMLLDML